MSSYGVGQGLAQAGNTILNSTMQLGQMKQRQDYIDSYRKRNSLAAFGHANAWDPTILMSHYQPEEDTQPMQAQRLGAEVPLLTAGTPPPAPRAPMQMERMGMGAPRMGSGVGMTPPRPPMQTDKIFKEFPNAMTPGRALAR